MRELEVSIADKNPVRKRYDRTATLSLPATRAAIEDARYRARIETGAECIVECRSGWPEFLKRIINSTDKLSLEEVNLLAYQISRMDEF